MGDYVLIDSCPAPRELVDELQVLKKDLGGRQLFNSIYRGEDAAALLHSVGKHTQAEIYATYPPGVANPPGRSTHELFSDGVAYEGPIGRKLEYWQVGLDINDADVVDFIDAARKRNWIVTITYPTSRVEYHHVNFRKEPDFDPFDSIKQGDSGDRVQKLTELLSFIHRPGRGPLYLAHPSRKFDADVKRAVLQFERDHKRKDPDGVVDKHTWQQLLVSQREEQQHRQIDRLKDDLRQVEKQLADLRKRRGDLPTDSPQVPHLSNQIDQLGDKAVKIRGQIRDLGGNPATA